MRQPQVGRLLHSLVAALVLAAPVVAAPALTMLTPTPLVEALDATTDRYRPGGWRAGAPLVLVHGLTAHGKDDPRLQRAARLLARLGLDVAVPTMPGLTRGRLRPDDAQPVMRALASRPEAARLISVSVGAAPAFLAAADPAAAGRVRMLLALGAHASTLELIRFHVTGEYAWNAVRGRVARDPDVIRAFIDANADLVDAALRTALISGDAARVDAAMAALPAGTRSVMAELSPERRVAAIRAPIVLVHGRADRAVPYSESLRLAAARPAHTRVVLVGAIAHGEGTAARLGGAADFLRLLGVVYGLLVGLD